ncbi:C-factor-like isoform X2 [Bradysia coprophila]|uniref:C-factor-like isoform X2 n=1 Tax=Bradysia coprophila TaxID=38358 RepID=UPI00187DA044|nr:C-factor-like isoform X2 [Bradysia coprophila]
MMHNEEDTYSMNYSTVLITGANRGIGLELVKQMASLSDPPTHIFATSRHPDKATILNELASKSSNIHVIECDVKNEESVAQLVSQVACHVGSNGLSLLINNAAIAFKHSLSTVNVHDLMDNYHVNAVAPLMITKQMLPLLKLSAENGRKTLVVNISSTLGSIAKYRKICVGDYQYTYRASKAALNMITRCLWVELKESKISVVAICPGWVQTDMGAPDADLTPTESVAGLLSTINHLNEEDGGKFFTFDGKPNPW